MENKSVSTFKISRFINEESYIDKLTVYLNRFKQEETDTRSTLLTKKQAHLIAEIQDLNEKAITPLQRLEHTSHPVTAFFILPVFALSNAGVHIDGKIMDMLVHPISIGIICGIVLGKFIGISLFSKLLVKFKIVLLPEGVSWHQIYGAAFLAGIGFTMSMFISYLAFKDESYKQIAKAGIIAASAISSIIGMLWLGLAAKKKE